MRGYTVIVLIVAMFLSGCGGQRIRVERLTEGQIRADMQEGIHALRDKNLRRILRDIAPDWRMTLSVEFEGSQQTHVLNKRQYRDLMRATLKEGDYISLSLSNVVIEISENGQDAIVVAEVHQEFAYPGQTVRSHGIQTNTIRLINGYAIDVQAEGFTKQELLAEQPPGIYSRKDPDGLTGNAQE